MSASTYSSRDRVRAALLRQPTDRAPFSWGFGPTGEMSAVLRQTLAAEGLAWDKLVVATNDVVTLSPRYTGPPLPAGRDLWGIGRQTMGYEGGQYSELAVLPLAGCTTPEQVDAHAWPNPDDWADDTFAAEIDAWQERHGANVRGGGPRSHAAGTARCGAAEGT